LSAAGFADAEEIGRGGFGIVYRCRQVALERTVAVKVLTAELDQNRERFLREQRAMGRLTGHPKIVGTLQVGETQSGYAYPVMQYHRRGSLETRIRRLGPLGVNAVLRLGVKWRVRWRVTHPWTVSTRCAGNGSPSIRAGRRFSDATPSSWAESCRSVSESAPLRSLIRMMTPS
jgi:hypothetical protein